MELTRDAVEFQAGEPRRGEPRGGRRMSAHEPSRRGSRGRPRHAGARRALRVDEAALAALDALVAARRRRARRSASPLLFAAIVARALGAHEPAASALDRHPLDVALAGVNLAQLAIGVLGVLVITGEYSTGMIRSTLQRRAEAAAGAVGEGGVFAAVTFALMLPAVLIAFFGGQAILDAATTSSDLVLAPGRRARGDRRRRST